MKQRQIALLGFLLLSFTQTTWAKFRTWNITGQGSVRAEFVSEKTGLLILKISRKKTIRVSMRNLSSDDLAYLKTTFPLTLKVALLTTKERYNEGRYFSRNDLIFRDKITITQTSKISLSEELTATFFVIGRKSRENKFVVLDKTIKKFRLSTSKPFTIWNGYRMFPDHDVLFDVKRYGYLLLITDKAGKVISAESDRDVFAEKYKSFLKANRRTWLTSKLVII